MPAARCRTLVADCPWLFDLGTSANRAKFRGTVDGHYPAMTLEDLCAFPLPPLDFDCRLFFWRVSSMQEEAFRVIRAWGERAARLDGGEMFAVKSELVWCKLTKNGKRHFGMGRQVRMEHEVCLIATRGRPERRSMSVRSTFSAPMPLDDRGRPRHSAKPDRFYEIVEELSPGPFVELFARRPRPGWSCYGNELEVAAPTALAAS